MTANISQVIAQALYDAGIRVLTSVPGFGCTQIFDSFRTISGRDLPVSFHEEVAFTIGYGASIVGQRSATIIKAHGLAKAANSLVDAMAAGTTAGFIALVPDDRLGKHSDSILDVAAFLQGLKIPFKMLELQNVYGQVRDAFSQSEKLQLPIVLLMNVDELEQEESYHGKAYRGPLPKYQRNVSQHVLCPMLAEYQHRLLSAKLSGNRQDAPSAPTLPIIPDSLPSAWQSIARMYASLFSVFQELRGKIVTGDTGVSTLFAFPPYACIDICTYMGGSIPLAIGANLAGYSDAWAVTGDFSFIAAGHLGLLEANQRRLSIKVLLLDNGKAETTGGQPILKGMLQQVLSGYERFVKFIGNPQDATEIQAVFAEAKQAQEMRIVVANYR